MAVLATGPANAQSQTPPVTASVDDQRLLSAGTDNDWITFGRDYSNQRFAPQNAINRGNVARLVPAWIYQLGTVGSTQTHPLVVGGVMYVTMPGNDVAAVDAATGTEIWRYRHKVRGEIPRIPSNRGVAVAYGLVFEATDDHRVVALDQATGKPVWDQAVNPFDPTALLVTGQKKPDIEFVLRAAPLVYDGKVIVGATGFEENRFDDDVINASVASGVDVGAAWIKANLGRRGFLSALDARTGAEAWRWYSSKDDGWEGGFAETAPDGTPLHRNIAAEKAAAPHYRNGWAAASNSTWMTPAFDPKAGLIFVGTGNPAPGDVDMIRPGDNLYANGVAALDAKTGGLRWFFQASPHGQYDATGQVVLLDVTAGGRKVPAAVECGKAGWCFVIDRASGKLLFRSDEFAPHQNTYPAAEALAAKPEGIEVAPGPGGALTVSPVSYDPASGILYVAGRHEPSVQTRVPLPNVPGGPALFKMISKPVTPDRSWGTLTALDLGNGGKALWQVRTSRPLVGGTLATAGGIVFAGEANGRFGAYDSATGKILWSFQTGATVGAPPMSYTVNGRQFVAVATGADPSSRGLRPGGAIMVFALPDQLGP